MSEDLPNLLRIVVNFSVNIWRQEFWKAKKMTEGCYLILKKWHIPSPFLDFSRFSHSAHLIHDIEQMMVVNSTFWSLSRFLLPVKQLVPSCAETGSKVANEEVALSYNDRNVGSEYGFCRRNKDSSRREVYFVSPPHWSHIQIQRIGSHSFISTAGFCKNPFSVYFFSRIRWDFFVWLYYIIPPIPLYYIQMNDEQ